MKEKIKTLQDSFSKLIKIEDDLKDTFGGDPFSSKFSLDGVLLGSFGEVVAALCYDLTLNEDNSQAGFDAITKDDKKVEIRTVRKSKSFKISSKADYLLCLYINSESKDLVFEEIYNGSANNKELKTGDDFKKSIAIGLLKGIKNEDRLEIKYFKELIKANI